LYGIVCVILYLAIFIQCRLVTDRQTNTQTAGNSIYLASIASHYKNYSVFRHSQFVIQGQLKLIHITLLS